MKYIVLTYEGSDSQMVVECLGPETVLGMVADVVRGNYVSPAGKKVVKVEIGDMVRDEHVWRIPTYGEELQGSMRGRRTHNSTRVFTLPGGTEDNDLWVYDMDDGQGNNIIVSVWEPTPQEREAIADGENIRLLVWGPQGYRIPPFGIDTTDEPLGKAP